MIEILSGFLTSLKQTSPVIFGGLAIASGIVLFTSGDFVDSIGLTEFKNSNLPLIGGGFVISISILVAQLIFNAYGLIKSLTNKFSDKKEQERIQKLKLQELSKLTPDEKSYLQPYIEGQKISLNFRMEDGIKSSLTHKGILYQANQMGDMLSGWAYNIQPWAKEHLESNRHLLDGASDAVNMRIQVFFKAHNKAIKNRPQKTWAGLATARLLLRR